MQKRLKRRLDMKSKQVLSIDQMKHLRELGLNTSDASMHWQFLPTVESFFNGVLALEGRPTLFVSQPNMKHEYPAYTLHDILDKLPSYITYNDEEYQLQILPPCICYRYVNYTFDDLDYKNNVDILENAYNMLCWCIENGYILKEGEQ